MSHATVDASALRPKALSILREGRLSMLQVRSDEQNRLFLATARVEGHRGVYAVDFIAGQWLCTCRGEERPCGHIAAAQMVVAAPAGVAEAPS